MSPIGYPAARRAQLVVEELEGEVLVYDLDRDQASCLNPTAALVWKLADGATSVPEIARQMAAQLDTPVEPRMVWYALDQLGKKNLLEAPLVPPLEYTRMTRRDFLIKAGMVGAAVTIPVIVSLAAPSAAMAATCTSGCTCPGGQSDCDDKCNGLTCSVNGCCQ